jgi:ankyrin repeat protein
VKTTAKAQPASWRKLLKAILDNDAQTVARLLSIEPSLARHSEAKGRFIASVPHWFYRGDTALHLCAAAQRVGPARLILQHGADVNARNFRKAMPLHYAVDARPSYRGKWDTAHQIEMISLLARNGADLDARDVGGITPLHRAVRARSPSAVGQLLKLGAKVDSKSKKGSTPLHLAAQSTGAGGTAGSFTEQIEIVQILLAQGASPKSKDERGRTPIDWATRDEILQLLIAAKGQPKPRRPTRA